MSENYFRTRIEELGLTPNDVAFHLAKEDVQVSGQAIRNWMAGLNAPSLALADPLAKVLKTTRTKILEAMHSIAEARAEKIAG